MKRAKLPARIIISSRLNAYQAGIRCFAQIVWIYFVPFKLSSVSFIRRLALYAQRTHFIISFNYNIDLDMLLI